MDRIKQRLNVQTSKKDVNTNTYLKVNLDSTHRLLPPDQIDYIVNEGTVFNDERQASSFYRILGTINPTISNPLFNLNDPTLLNNFTWAGFNNVVFLDTSYPPTGLVDEITDYNYSDSIKNNLKEVEGWFGYFDPNITAATLCAYYDMEPKRQRFSFLPDISPYKAPTAAPVKNWELTITYPKEMDKKHPMVNGGLLMVDYQEATVATRTMVAFGMPCSHNLSVGDSVIVTGTTGFDGQYIVVRTGLDNGDLQDNYFVVDIPYSAGSIGNTSRMIRLFAGQPSEYYFRLFRKIQTRDMPVIQTSNYETYNLAFSENIYTDTISQFVFNEDINVNNLTDNLGRPLSQIYLSIIKTSSAGSPLFPVFGQVSSGIETPFIPNLNTSNINTYLQSVPAINKIHNGGSLPFPTHIPLESSVTIDNNNNILNNNDFYGDLVEYNIMEVQETVLADIFHRFNTVNRESSPTLSYVNAIGNPPPTTTISLGPRQEGYFYKAHNLITIRQFSNYVNQGYLATDIIPDYAINLGDGTYLWRDLLDIGFNDTNSIGLDYPFVNGCHYMYNNYCFYVRRQDPFDNWGLFYSNFPADPIGETMTDEHTINSSQDVC